jgi:hypothetical protein
VLCFSGVLFFRPPRYSLSQHTHTHTHTHTCTHRSQKTLSLSSFQSLFHKQKAEMQHVMNSLRLLVSLHSTLCAVLHSGDFISHTTVIHNTFTFTFTATSPTARLHWVTSMRRLLANLLIVLWSVLTRVDSTSWMLCTTAQRKGR